MLSPEGWYWMVSGSLGPFQQMLQEGCCNTSRCQNTQRYRCISSPLSTLGRFRTLGFLFPCKHVTRSCYGHLIPPHILTSQNSWEPTASSGSTQVLTANSKFNPTFSTQKKATAQTWTTSVLSNWALQGPLRRGLADQRWILCSWQNSAPYFGGQICYWMWIPECPLFSISKTDQRQSGTNVEALSCFSAWLCDICSETLNLWCWKPDDVV